ncbi:MAG: sugar ABC transporter ATP-binding protein [Spirochaetota bacterium]
MAEEPLLRAEKIDKSFPGVHALDEVDFTLNRGEVHVLLGENGAGKSTLMKIFSGTVTKDSGKIMVRGREAHIANPVEAMSLGIGMVYQELSVIPTLSVAENIFLGRLPRRKTGTIHWPALFSETRRLLNELHVHLNPRRRVGSLGMAERQLVEIAKALSMNVRILLLDEPTSALSYEERDRLFDIIRRLQDRGVGVVYVSHRLDEVPMIGNRVTVLRDGRWMGTFAVEETDQETLINLMVGRRLGEHFPKQKVPIGRELLRVEGLTAGDRVRNVSFAVRQGEIVGIAGLMGAGRTELVRAVFGIDPVERGRIYVEGREVTITSPWEAISLGIGFLTENRMGGLVPLLSVSANITMASLKSLRRGGFLDQQLERDLARKYVKELDIHTAGPAQRVQFLSGGNQQKVAIAKWLCTNAKIMIFDEPTRGIDVGAKTEVFRLMNQLAADGVGVIMISSELPEVLAMADRILVMCRGAVTAELEHGKTTQEEVLRYAIIGEEQDAGKG